MARHLGPAAERSYTPLLACLAILIWSAAGAADETDLHALFEDRCSSCHGHSASFARERLQLDPAGQVVGSRGQSLDRFLARHAGGLDTPDIAPLLSMFARQIGSDPVFQQRCLICHDRAHELARLELILRDGVLFGRYTGREIGPFLRQHGRLTEQEAAAMTEALARILLGNR